MTMVSISAPASPLTFSSILSPLGLSQQLRFCGPTNVQQRFCPLEGRASGIWSESGSIQFVGPLAQKHWRPSGGCWCSGGGRASVSRRGLVLGSVSISWIAAGVVAVAATGTLAMAAMAGQGGRQQAMVATRKGMQLFSQGDVKGSLEKFDEAMELDPQSLPYLWQRGLSLYYVDRFEEGAKQFRGDVAVNPNDTEEAIWCFLCEAQYLGIDEARRRFLVVGPDRRPIMKEIYELFKNGGSTEELLQAVDAPEGADYFYANLYAGLYHEAHGSQDAAKEAFLAAVRSFYGTRSGDYMATLARVHAKCRGWKDIGAVRGHSNF